MRIAFIGKGGSGKTTLSSLTARLTPTEFKELYVVDSDINMHMKGALSAHDTTVNSFTPVFNYYEKHIRAQHPALVDLKSLPRTLPPWSSNHLHTLGFNTPPFNTMEKINSNTLLLELGGYSEKTIGWSCHHGSLGKLQLVLAHTHDTNEQLVIADLTAGADVFGVGLLGLFDMVFVVVEPTMKSTDIFLQLSELAKFDDVELVPIANKVIDDTDITFISNRIGQKPVHRVSMSNFVRRLERGEKVSNSDIEPANRKTISRILTAVKSHQRDEEQLYSSVVKSHKRAALNWPKDKYGTLDLLSLINPNYPSQS